jgi:lysozyme family protein
MFSDFLPILRRSEGGYSNVSADKGGETYAGITKKNFPTWAGWAIVNKARPTQGQIISDPKLDALIGSFYKKNFWDVLKCDNFSKYVGMNLCDFAINSGINTAAKSFQEVINSLLPVGTTTLIADGKIGPLTIAAANKLNQKVLNDALLLKRANFYKKIVENNPSQNVFLTGWLTRLTSFVSIADVVDKVKKKINMTYVYIGVAIVGILIVIKYKK